jgi:hypothetical protein
MKAITLLYSHSVLRRSNSKVSESNRREETKYNIHNFLLFMIYIKHTLSN